MSELITIPRKIYYVKATGEFVADTGQRTGTNIRQTTIDEDFDLYSELSKYNRDAIGCIELEINQYGEDFAKCKSFRVNPDTQLLEFTYREDVVTNEPIYQKPLTEQISELESRTKATEDMILALMGGM